MTSNLPPLPPLQPAPYQPPFPTAAPRRTARRFGLLAAIIRAPFASSELYRDAATNWRGIAAGLLVVVLAISWAASLLKIHVALRNFAQNEFPALVKDVPPLTIQNGVVSSPVPQPYTVMDPQSHQPFAILDTSGEITSLDNSPAIVLVTRNKLIMKERGNGQTRIQDLSKISSFFVDRNRLTRWMDAISRWSAIAVFPAVLVGSFAYRLIQCLIYGLAGMVFGSIFNARLDFAALMRLSVLAVTPVILLSTVVDLAGVAAPVLWPVCFVIAMVYLALAVRANAEPPTQPR